MNKGNAVIVLGGEFKHLFNFKERIVNLLLENGLLIGVDSGADYIKTLNLRPDLLIGDFDSISNSTTVEFADVEKIVFPTEKDMTDGELALREVIKRGYNKIVMFGATGGRVDHFLQNILLLELADSLGACASIEHEGGSLELLTPNRLDVNFEVTELNTISLIPLSEVAGGVTTEGLKYSLNNANMQRGLSLGISNTLRDILNTALSNVPKINSTYRKVSVSIKDGKLLVIKNSF